MEGFVYSMNKKMLFSHTIGKERIVPGFDVRFSVEIKKKTTEKRVVKYWRFLIE